MKRALILAVVLGVMAAAKPATVGARGLGRFTGTVVDQTGQAVPGVEIKATSDDGDIQTKSDDKGDWAVAGVGKGTYHVVFVKGGYTPVAARVILEAELARVPPIKITLKKN